MKFVRPVLILVFSQMLQEEGCGGNMTLVAIEAVLAGSEPPVVVVVRISPGDRHDFGASVLSSTRASSLHIIGRAGGSVESPPKLVRRIGS